VKIDFYSASIPKDLPTEISLCLFRIMQEALQNAIKHSESPHVEVRLSNTANEIQLSVRDDGIGFDPNEAIKSRGIGLISMQERLKLVGGLFSIESQLQHGTTIRAQVRLNDSKKFVGARG
jgi:signal transduction histidine kinase